MDRDLDIPDQPDRQKPGRDVRTRPTLPALIPLEQETIVPEQIAPDRENDQRHDGRAVFELRQRSYRLNNREAQVLTEVGIFRVIEKGELMKQVYRGDKASFDRDLTHLHRQNLVRIIGSKASPIKYVSLAKPARELVQRYLRSNPDQTIHAGPVKRREIEHDAALYRMYRHAAQDIANHGGKPRRVHLDFEFRRRINRQLAKSYHLPKPQRLRHLLEVAQRENLKVVNGKVPIPDVRIEYETAGGGTSYCDLELVTTNYKAETVAERSAAGFRLYGSSRRGRSANGPDLMGGIISR